MTPRSNPLLAVEELHLTKQGSMTSQEFHSQILEIVKRCRFPNQAAEDRAVRDAIFIGMNSQRAKDKAINFMNEEEWERGHSGISAKPSGNRRWKLSTQVSVPNSIPVLLST